MTTSKPLTLPNGGLSTRDCRLDLVADDGTVVYDLLLHRRAFCALCVAMIDTILWAFPEASGWRVVDMSSGECVTVGVRGEVS